MKMRSWSSSEGIMLVPSTLTGWYRNTMMNAEIPREMIRSRTHADMSLPAREEVSCAISCGRGEVGSSDIFPTFYTHHPCYPRAHFARHRYPKGSRFLGSNHNGTF